MLSSLFNGTPCRYHGFQFTSSTFPLVQTSSQRGNESEAIVCPWSMLGFNRTDLMTIVCYTTQTRRRRKQPATTMTKEATRPGNPTSHRRNLRIRTMKTMTNRMKTRMLKENRDFPTSDFFTYLFYNVCTFYHALKSSALSFFFQRYLLKNCLAYLAMSLHFVQFCGNDC